MNPTGLGNPEEKHLLNEIAHLTNLLESSKRQAAVRPRGAWPKKVEKFTPYNFTQASSMMKKVNNQYSLRKFPSSSPSSPVKISDKNVKKPEAPSSKSSAAAVDSEKNPPLQVDQQKEPERKRYYAVELNSDTVVKALVVERRLPPDVVEIPRKKIKEESNDDNNNCQKDTESKVCASSSSVVQVSNGKEADDSVAKCLSVDVSSSVVKDEGYQLRRNRLLSRLSKLTSHKERVKGQSYNNTSSSLPAYLPC